MATRSSSILRSISPTAKRCSSSPVLPRSSHKVQQKISAGKCEPAFARFDGPSRRIALNGCVDSEHVERIVARRMHLADQNRAHQLVITSAEKGAIAVQSDIGRQRVALQRSRKDN